MAFNRLLFLSAFTLFILIYYKIKKTDTRQYFLIAASMLFYGSWNFLYLPLILGSTLIDYICGGIILRNSAQSQKRFYCIISICSNLLVLFLFKYLPHENGGFFSSVVIPLGLSFHTLQGMSYVIDIYKERSAPAKRYADFLLYVVFFPQLIAGPIVRAGEFFPRLQESLATPKPRATIALLSIFAVGFFKKTCIADNLAPLVDRAFSAPEQFGFVGLVVMTFANITQIYCDFSGYCDMGFALAGLLGFAIPINFFAPLLSTNVHDLWKRWNSSVSAWFRDYVYEPLGGKSESMWRWVPVTIVTFFLSGLWHGSALPMLLFGLLWGLAIVVSRFTGRQWAERFPILGWLITVSLFAFFSIFFRAQDGGQLSRYLKAFGYQPDVAPELWPLFLLLLALLGCHFLYQRYRPHEKLESFCRPELFYFVLGGAFCLMLALGRLDYKPFIYFQF